ncbi:T9SS type A sorting domain-containing protein [Candidatus Fermentibacteria bacterium]|nr:T9SS type A sorting domain-containing protein [Candidatus Fermentibacteria bacterium]
MSVRRRAMGGLVLFGALVWSAGHTQPAQVRGVFGNGGGTTEGAGHRLRGVFGQSLAGRVMGPSNHGLCGFWYGVPIVTEVPQCPLPVRFVVDQSYPNPCRAVATIRYALPQNSTVSLQVYDVHGREIGHVPPGSQPAGYHDLTLTVSSLASGVYLYRLRAGDQSVTRRLVVVR